MDDVVERLLAGGPGDVDLTDSTAARLADAVRDRSGEVEGAMLFVALVSHPQQAIACPAAVELVKAADVLALMEIASWLGRGGAVPAPSAKALGRAFLDRANDRASDYGGRANALKAAMIMAQRDEGLLLRLAAEMVDLDVADDGDYLRHAAAVAGAVLAHRPNVALRDVLAAMVDVPEAEDEAAMELGLDALRDGLDAAGHDAALDAFRRARGWFRRAEDASEARVDARLYRDCLDVLVVFQTGEASGDLGERVDAVRTHAFAYAAFLAQPTCRMENASWLGARDRERVHWSMLAMRLGALNDKVTRGAWLKAAAAMEEELLSVYAASRSLLRRDADGGLDLVLRPRVVGAMQRDLGALHVLEQWIKENAGSAQLPDAQGLRERVTQGYEKLLARSPPEAAVGSSPAVAIVELLEAGARATVSARIEANAVALLDDAVSGTVDGVLRDVLAGLERNVDYRDHADARAFFQVLVLYATRFAVSRHNVSVATLPAVGYLFVRDKDKLPLEGALQRDFIQFVQASPLADMCSAEARDLGGGRVDVLFAHRWVRTTSEIKRCRVDLRPDELVDAYGPQAVSYQGTNVGLAMLMVLDLHDRKGAQLNFRDQVSVHHRSVAGSSVETAVVLFRIQGRRHTPSHVPKATLSQRGR